jgi:hypothetical protein
MGKSTAASHGNNLSVREPVFRPLQARHECAVGCTASDAWAAEQMAFRSACRSAKCR